MQYADVKPRPAKPLNRHTLIPALHLYRSPVAFIVCFSRIRKQNTNRAVNYGNSAKRRRRRLTMFNNNGINARNMSNIHKHKSNDEKTFLNIPKTSSGVVRPVYKPEAPPHSAPDITHPPIRENANSNLPLFGFAPSGKIYCGSVLKILGSMFKYGERGDLMGRLVFIDPPKLPYASSIAKNIVFNIFTRAYYPRSFCSPNTPRHKYSVDYTPTG
ncbi:conserved hypothetical protein [Trichinella spiralis]|uniref:hypothetical protein n=1 Tax=Trichinella spiralis TaxID=6334 RepID=UPI0001EFE02A|nr:conserved hypothetical protein [Trichinella spiralis]